MPIHVTVYVARAFVIREFLVRPLFGGLKRLPAKRRPILCQVRLSPCVPIHLPGMLDSALYFTQCMYCGSPSPRVPSRSHRRLMTIIANQSITGVELWHKSDTHSRAQGYRLIVQLLIPSAWRLKGIWLLWIIAWVWAFFSSLHASTEKWWLAEQINPSPGTPGRKEVKWFTLTYWISFSNPTMGI